MRTMNLDMLVRAGQQPWLPVPQAEDIDVWDKYDFPICGTYRLDSRLVIFTLVASAGNRSLWAYVPVPPESEEAVSGARFEAEEEFNEFLAGCFAGRKAVFAAAEDFVITSKSDGIVIPSGRFGLLTIGAEWYALRAAVELRNRLTAASEAGNVSEVLSVAQDALSGLPA